MESKKTFGETVRELREEKGLPLREVAKALSIDTSMLGKVEKGSRKPTKNLITAFANFFNVSQKELIINFLSDKIAYQMLEEDYADEVLQMAEQKVKYLKDKKKTNL